MSKRHHSQETVPPTRVELRAHAHNERHRIHAALDEVAELVSQGIPAEDLHEPGKSWRVEAHHDKERAIRKNNGPLKHWKTKDWKRRKTIRRQKAAAWQMLA